MLVCLLATNKHQKAEQPKIFVGPHIILGEGLRMVPYLNFDYYNPHSKRSNGNI